MARDKYRDRSVLIHGKFRSEKWDFQDHILPPITTSSAFRMRSAERGAEGFQQYANPEVDRATEHPIYLYQRLDEPCQGLLEETLAYSEKGACAVSFASGMAAISAVFGVLVKSGEEIVYHPTIYGCTHSLLNQWLPRLSVRSRAVDLSDPELLAASLKPETRVVYFETPCNPTMRLIDIELVAQVVAKANENRKPEERIRVVVDNTFASPFGQRPLQLGADIVVASLTKHISGFGATMGGAVIAKESELETHFLLWRKDFGGSLAPDAAWHILNYGIPTLSLRLEKQQKNAMEVANSLQKQKLVSKVVYPGLEDFPQRKLAEKQMRDIDGNFAPGALIYLEVAGDHEQAKNRAVRLINRIAANALSVTIAVSLGQIRTLMEHPASMTHAAIPPEQQLAAGVHPGGVRMALGVEDPQDIISDLEEAFAPID
jgi:cystathionine beta-lyase/cystathionine gamma-synthase